MSFTIDSAQIWQYIFLNVDYWRSFASAWHLRIFVSSHTFVNSYIGVSFYSSTGLLQRIIQHDQQKQRFRLPTYTKPLKILGITDTNSLLNLPLLFQGTAFTWWTGVKCGITRTYSRFLTPDAMLIKQSF